MDIDNAWSKFEKTGAIKDYMEYKNLCRQKEEIKSSVNLNKWNSDKDN